MTTTIEEEESLRKDAKKLYSRASDPLEKMRLFCLTRGHFGIYSLSREFRGMDDDGNKKLTKDEFVHGVASYGVEMSKREMEDCFKKMDKNRSGHIDFNEFLMALRPPMNEFREDLVARAFSKLDRSGDGVVTIKDLDKRIDLSENEDVQRGKVSEKEMRKRFIRWFDKGNPDGTVTYQEFLDYYAGVSASVDRDDYFEEIMVRGWHL